MDKVVEVIAKIGEIAAKIRSPNNTVVQMI
jgi:hypothetical protein